MPTCSDEKRAFKVLRKSIISGAQASRTLMTGKSKRIALKVEYQGESFCGSQMQKGVRTVQEELEKALNVFFRGKEARSIKLTFSGRTDSGVSSLGQVAHFDLADELLAAAFEKFVLESAKSKSQYSRILGFDVSAFDICRSLAESSSRSENRSESDSVQFKRGQTASTNEKMNELFLRRICWALNGILPEDVSVTRAQAVPDQFNARFSAVRRTYVYKILNRPQRSAVRQKKHYFIAEELNLELMKEASRSLLGKFDFRAFKSSNADIRTTVCTVDRAEFLNKGEDELEFWISANHFVYNMVRIIVGTLIEVGLGKRAPEAMAEALAGKDRHLAGPTAPPWGLCLYSVEYPAEFNLFKEKPEKVISVSQEK